MIVLSLQRSVVAVGRRFFSSSYPTCTFNAGKLSPSLTNLLKNNGITITQEDCQTELSKPLLENLHDRGLIETCVNEEELQKTLFTRKLGLYCGADPTAKSLHLGNLLPLMILLHFNIHGHNIFPLIGGATGAVGDPSGRTTERTSMTNDSREDHVTRISHQLINFFKMGISYASTRNPAISTENCGAMELKNNYSWWKDMRMLQFLSNYGKFIRVNQMLARDSIRNRISSEQGIGFNEFAYQVLQAYDYYYLNKTYGVDVQVGGKDQYGNIVAGIDFINRINKSKTALTETKKPENDLKQCFGLTVPLLTTASGVKFGKSAGNAIFIDPELTPTFDIYQFMYRTEDEDVERFLCKFSLLPLSVIHKIVKVHMQDKSKRFGQKILAFEICDLIHGDGEGLLNYETSKLIYGNPKKINADQVIKTFGEQNLVTKISMKEFLKISVPNLLFKMSNGAQSKSEFRRMMKTGAVLNGLSKKMKLKDPRNLLKRTDLIDDKLLMLKAGKKLYLAEVTE